MHELPVLRSLDDARPAPDCAPCALDGGFPRSSIEGGVPAPASVHRRFDRTARLLGEASVLRLGRASVMVCGLGGVGSFAAEGLVRSGVGALRLVDFDRVCVTNTNRQLHAMKGTLGKSKAEVMAERLRLVNPDATLDVRPAFYEPESSDALLAPRPDLVVDAIDNMRAKLHLIATCLARGIPLVSSMGAAARLDPTKIRIADLARTRNDPFAAELRRLLRKKHGVDCTRPTGVLAVYSEERPVAPQPVSYDADGFRCVCPHGQNEHHSCDHRNRIEGSVGFVTSVFGMTCAAAAVRLLTAA
jgi:tRNA A37 threonylcarbamoyladenosine dehydratase